MLEKVGALAEDGPRKLRVTRETGKDAVLGLGVWWSMGIVVYSQCVLITVLDVRVPCLTGG